MWTVKIIFFMNLGIFSMSFYNLKGYHKILIFLHSQTANGFEHNPERSESALHTQRDHTAAQFTATVLCKKILTQ